MDEQLPEQPAEPAEEPAREPAKVEDTKQVRMPADYANRINRIVGTVQAKTGNRKFSAADVFQHNRESFEGWLAQVEAWAEGLSG